MWYEPTWLALRVCKKSHDDFCATGIADGYPKLWHEQGVAAERERIIALLEPLAKHDESCYDNGKLSCYFEDCQASSYEYAIELIKGEQK
jgi:hypothetical protein